MWDYGPDWCGKGRERNRPGACQSRFFTVAVVIVKSAALRFSFQPLGRIDAT
jgi:hypothetical protein